MKRVLFVCLGNICRSPAAEGIFEKMITDARLQDQFEWDSAGTSAYHQGEEADGRMQFFAEKRGYELKSLSRGFNPKTDFVNFDYIFTMDHSNFENVLAMDRNGEFRSKVIKLTDLCRVHEIEEVPDPYYGGDRGFEHVMDILEDACTELVGKLKSGEL